jgi:hypothetical protein
MNELELIGLLASLIGIYQFIKELKVEYESAIRVLDLPSEVNFYFMLFWAFVAACLGGLLWSVINLLNETLHFMGPSPYVGGTQSEPHGVGAIIWPISTNIFTVLILIVLNRKYRFIGILQQLLLYGLFLVGLTVGSVIFYDLPISGKIGFRNYFDATEVSYLPKEFCLALIWSSLISISAFLFTGLTNMALSRMSKNFKMAARIFSKQNEICIGLTTCAVLFFISAFPDQPRFETARGIVAGLFLRIALFFGLVFFGKSKRVRLPLILLK